MTVRTSSVSEQQVERILALGEGQFLDVKAKELAPAKMTRHISAFANADGGEIYLGVADKDSGEKDRWRGFGDEEEANAHLQVLAEQLPLGQHYSCQFLGSDKRAGLVLHIQVDKNPAIVTDSKGVAYLRKGAQSLPQTSDEQLKRLELDKGVSSFEDQTVAGSVEVISDSLCLTGFLLEVVPSVESASAWLASQQLIVSGNPTVAGVILFADEPQAIIPKRCGIKILRYKTKGTKVSRDLLDGNPITVEGSAKELIIRAVQKTKEVVEEIPKLEGSELMKVEYPTRALHEIIANAVLHRDYSVQSDVQILVFDNRIEVSSPGRLPGHITRENILDEQFSRNPRLVRLVNKFPSPPNKDVGEGLNTAFDEMRRVRLKEPIVEETEFGVVVTLRHEPLASPEDLVLQYLATHPDIVNRKGRELTGIESENEMKRVFYVLRDAELIEKVPYRNRWRKKGTGQ